MTFRSQIIKSRLFLCLVAFSSLLACSPLAFAAEGEEETTKDPVWVLSYAGLIFFVGSTIILAILFSRSRPDSVLNHEEQKNVEKLRAERFKKRQKDVKHQVVEKLFREIAPKYKKRAEEKGQGGGYTRLIKKGPRRGDAAEMVILEFI